MRDTAGSERSSGSSISPSGMPRRTDVSTSEACSSSESDHSSSSRVGMPNAHEESISKAVGWGRGIRVGEVQESMNVLEKKRVVMCVGDEELVAGVFRLVI